jgi:hypothetical protein
MRVILATKFPTIITMYLQCFSMKWFRSKAFSISSYFSHCLVALGFIPFTNKPRLKKTRYSFLSVVVVFHLVFVHRYSNSYLKRVLNMHICNNSQRLIMNEVKKWKNKRQQMKMRFFGNYCIYCVKLCVTYAWAHA